MGVMSIINLTIDGIAIACGLLLLYRSAVLIHTYRQQADGLAPRAKHRWKWLVWRSISAAVTFLALGLFGITRPSDIFAWLLFPAVIAAGTLIVCQIRLSEFGEHS